jgi:DNA-binding NarL/FixJ family response regulator
MSVVQILVVDDSLPWQSFVLRHLETETDFKAIVVASDGLDAIRKASELRPEVILMDVCLPGISGIEVTRQIRKVSPGSKILFVSLHDDSEIIQAAFGAGASGYVLKWHSGKDLIPGIRAILLGQQFVSPSLAGWHGCSDANA